MMDPVMVGPAEAASLVDLAEEEVEVEGAAVGAAVVGEKKSSQVRPDDLPDLALFLGKPQARASIHPAPVVQIRRASFAGHKD